MTELELLAWAHGSGFQIASMIFVFGIIVRFFEVLMMGRKKNLAEARGSEMSGGLRTIVSRFVPDSGTFQRSTFTIVTGYIFHIGFFVTLFLFTPHNLVFKDVFGLSWPALPTALVDATAVISIIALFAILIHRLRDNVQRYLSGFQDYFVWLVTLLPLLTGYIAFHRMGLPAPSLLAIHILSVELLMVVFPFTKLMHAFTLFLARWYNGAVAGYKGVQS